MLVWLEEYRYDEVEETGQMTDLQQIVPPPRSQPSDGALLRVSVTAVAQRQQAQAGQSDRGFVISGQGRGRGRPHLVRQKYNNSSDTV